MVKSWQPGAEKKIIKKYKGDHQPTKNKYDGIIRGRAIEVKHCKMDNRFRINQDNHRYMVRQNGSYLFVAGSKEKKIPAKKVSELIGRGKWFKDREYPHKFLNKKKIF